MRDTMMPWGRSQRICIGKQIAVVELKTALAAIVKKFQVRRGTDTVDGDMEMTDHFVWQAKGGKCMLKFQAV